MPSQKKPTKQTDGTKEQFRQALERKKQQQADGVAEGRAGNGAQGKADTHQHGGKREFRRKSG